MSMRNKENDVDEPGPPPVIEWASDDPELKELIQPAQPMKAVQERIVNIEQFCAFSSVLNCWTTLLDDSYPKPCRPDIQPCL